MTSQHESDHEREALEQELLELHFGCHENPDLLEARLRDEPELQKLYADVQRQASIMVTAACDPIGDLELPIEEAKAPLKPLRMRPRLLRLGIAAAPAPVLFAPFYLSWAWNKSTRDAIADTLVQVSLASGQATPDGAPIAFTISTINYDKDIAACDIQWRALDADGKAIATGEATTDTNSTTEINLPAALQAVRKIEVTADTPRGPKQVAL
ncbi:MAG: hypothetical protein GY944_17415, partial [bacterium]|nr:hypothetical protein [bacterium]